MGAVTAHVTGVRNAMAEAVRADANTGGTPKLFIGNASATGPADSGNILASVSLGSTFGAASSGVISATQPAPFNATAAGTAARAFITRANNAEVYRGDVKTDTTGIVQLNTLTIADGDLITISSPVTYAAPP